MARLVVLGSLLVGLACARPGAAAPLVARLETELGVLRIELLPEHAPQHVENFQRLVDGTLYDGSTFHRVIPGYLIQGGSPTSRDNDPTNDSFGRGGYGIPLERNELRHVRGAVAMARDVGAGGDAPESSGAQFFIVLGDAPMLDDIGFTIFGRVIAGLEVADRIAAAPRDVANHDRPLRPIRIQRLVMESPEAAAAPAGAGVATPSRGEPGPVDIAAAPTRPPTGAAAPEPSPPAPDLLRSGPVEERQRVLQTLVNVRSAASTSAPVVARLPRGTEVRAVRRSGEWLEVDLGERRTGFIRSDMLEPVAGGRD